MHASCAPNILLRAHIRLVLLKPVNQIVAVDILFDNLVIYGHYAISN